MTDKSIPNMTDKSIPNMTDKSIPNMTDKSIPNMRSPLLSQEIRIYKNFEKKGITLNLFA